MQKEFKPCPFCGAGAENIYIKRNASKNGIFYYIECEICGGRTRGICRPWDQIKEPEKEESHEERWQNNQARTVMNLWNRRSDANA
jgi:hypothetical protein